MSSVTFNKAVNTNNNGVSLFELGKFEEAKETFEMSLAMMREAILEASKETLLSIKRRPPKASSDSFHWSEIPNRSSSSVGYQRTCGDHVSLSSSFFFQRAIIMEPTIRRSADEYGEETSAVVYNLALSCHCIAIERNSDAMLKRAVQFYKIAHSIFMHRMSSRSKDKTGVIMAIMNNLGQLHYDRMLEFDIAERCFQRLLTGLRGEEQDGEKQTRNGFNEDDFRGFMLNVMLGRPLLSAAA